MNYCNLAPENLLFAVEFDGKAEGYEQGLTQFTLQTQMEGWYRFYKIEVPLPTITH